MSKKLALIAILATALALPVSGALAAGHGGGGGGHGGGGHMGGGHMGGGHMGGGFGGGHLGGGRIGGGFGGGHMAGGIGPQARTAFGAARVHHGRFGHRRHLFVGGLGTYNYDTCWDDVWTPLGWQCSWPYEY